MPREVSGCRGKAAEAMLKRQESRMMCNTRYIGEKLKGLISIIRYNLLLHN